ncbi:lytic transglycosylase domain-containing protein [Halalkalibacterium ligniniphilum]|uniref:lytic transglycosylase domain-containing protein n=1 Tax=Halalkalibacterium ligniniphilum TaxID=1134413 RepID=UPI0003455D7A|nr:lytic transglycosylase domain-containing protein [Halalkalibacterium ligniniphilum]
MRKLLLFFLFFGLLFIGAGQYLFAQSEQVRHFTYKAVYGQHNIPAAFIPIYQEAGETYNIPWKLLASVHRVETIFSKMDQLESPVGAVGHFQFMPRTWVGWTYPGTDVGGIDEDVDITDLALIAEHQGYGVDATGNGKADPFDLYDATFSAAKYLADHGAADGDLEKALFAYNKSEAYVLEVMSFYESYQDHYNPITFPFDQNPYEHASE